MLEAYRYFIFMEIVFVCLKAWIEVALQIFDRLKFRDDFVGQFRVLFMYGHKLDTICLIYVHTFAAFTVLFFLPFVFFWIHFFSFFSQCLRATRTEWNSYYIPIILDNTQNFTSSLRKVNRYVEHYTLENKRSFNKTFVSKIIVVEKIEYSFSI